MPIDAWRRHLQNCAIYGSSFFPDEVLSLAGGDPSIRCFRRILQNMSVSARYQRKLDVG